MSTLRTAIPVLALFVCLAAAPAPAIGAASGNAKVSAMEVTQLPPVTLKVWKNSTEQERYAFLVGLVTMLELEKEWQGKKAVALKDSLVPSWCIGFEGVTMKQIHDGVNEYIAANPADMDRQVVEVLWYKYAQPKVTEKVDNPERIKQSKKTLKQKKS